MKRSVSRQLISTASPTVPALEGTITCAICQGVYAPSRLHAYLLQSTPIALESAFMSMCHFCFYCRRPSCPNCWDTVHGVCGQCAQETHVPFRVQTPPLAGTSYASPRSRFSTNDNSTPPSLVSVQPGLFQKSLSSFNIPSPTGPHHSYSSNLQPPFPIRSAGTIGASSPVDVDKMQTRPDHKEAPDIDSIQTRPDKSGLFNIDNSAAHPPSSTIRKKKPLHLFITLLLFCTFLIVLVVVASLLLEDVNMFVYAALHIDIRAELISLWSFLHSFL